ncbi:helix-turn-helix transcriptional regulator [Rhizobium puerariae]|uniref:Helix-turn-helix transcriptional regulator n=1 Tax=Rhizobium puerariae TaxID=1585791 RepID=A0ABV6AER4_9HYPH
MPAQSAEMTISRSAHPIPEFSAGMAFDIAKLLEEAGRHVDHDMNAVRTYLDRAHAMLTGLAAEQPAPADAGGLAPWQVKRVEGYIRSNIDGSVRTEDLAAASRLSVSHFSKAFKQSFGISPYAYVLNKRIARAKELLLSSDESLAQIALACGMSDQAHFSRLFRNLTGETPSRWRRSRLATT